ncbi:hypothetical protein LTSEURB_2764, partial [Salmonella enterica subsp. enterica serovar Urbana str. R8-2977]
MAALTHFIRRHTISNAVFPFGAGQALSSKASSFADKAISSAA